MADVKYLRYMVNGLPKTIDLTASGNVLNAFNFKITDASVDASKPLKLDASKQLTSGLIDLTSEVTGALPYANMNIADGDLTIAKTSGLQSALDGKLTKTLADGKIFIGNGSNEATAQTVSGDVTISNAGVTAISSGVIVDADVNASAAIAESKLALDYSTSGLNTAIGTKLDASEKGAANGVAPLDSSSKISAIYLPSYVDDVLEYANLAAFPGTGETAKIYIALDTNKTYRWSGSAYVEVSPNDVNSVNGKTGFVTLDADDISDASTTNKFLSATQKTDLTDGGDSTLHYHASDRDRANHTGTQLASTISDFDSAAKSAAVADAIVDAVTDVAPSQNAVYDALALKVDKTTTVNGHALSSNVTVTKSDVGLGNVDNVQQLPMSYLDVDGTLAANSDTKVPSQKAVKTYADTKVPQTRTVNGYALSSDVTITNSDVGLGNVDNVQQLPMSYLDTNTSLGTADDKVPSQNAVKSYVDSSIIAATPQKVMIDAVAGESFAANSTFVVRYALNAETAGRVYKATKLSPSDEKYWAIGVLQTTTALAAGDACKFIVSGELTLKSADVNVGSTDTGKPVFLGAAGAWGTATPNSDVTSGNEYASVVIGRVKSYNATVTSTVVYFGLVNVFGIDIA